MNCVLLPSTKAVMDLFHSKVALYLSLFSFIGIHLSRHYLFDPEICLYFLVGSFSLKKGQCYSKRNNKTTFITKESPKNSWLLHCPRILLSTHGKSLITFCVGVGDA